jgi:hypothetical protein
MVRTKPMHPLNNTLDGQIVDEMFRLQAFVGSFIMCYGPSCQRGDMNYKQGQSW